MMRVYRRAKPLLRMAIFIFAAIVILLLGYIRWWETRGEQNSDNLLIFLLVNLNIVFVCLTAILVGRRLVQLFFDRRKNILGARLRTRLVAAFIGVALVPTTLVFVLASGLIDTAIQGWFGTQMDSSVGASVEVSKQYFKLTRKMAESAVARSIEELKLLELDEAVANLEPLRLREGFFSLAIFNAKGRPLANSSKVLATIENFSEPALTPIEILDLAKQKDRTRLDEVNDRQFLRVVAQFSLRDGNYFLVGSMRIEPDLTHAVRIIQASLQEYEQTKFFKDPIKSGYILTLGLVTLLILFIAVWWGLYLARNITERGQAIGGGDDTGC